MSAQMEMQLGQKLRDYGLDSVEANNLPWVERIRKAAQHISDYKDTIEWIDVAGCEMIRRNQ